MQKHSPVLPPGLDGEAKYCLLLTIDEIIWLTPPQQVQVVVEWWGQNPSDAQVFTPVDVKNFKQSQIGDTLYVRYHIKTSLEKFTEYLRDATPLKVQVRNAKQEVVGITIIHNLEKVETPNGIDGYYPVIGVESHETLANLRTSMKIETVQRELKLSPPLRESRPKKTLQSRKKSLTDPPIHQTLTDAGPTNNKVTFDERNLATGGTTTNASVSTATGTACRTPLADSLVSELLNQSQQLRESMRRQLETSFHPTVFPSASNPNRDGCDPDPTIPFISEESDYNDEETLWPSSYSSRHETGAAVKQTSSDANSVPTWNIPVDRIKQLAKVSRISLHLSSVQIHPTILDEILEPSIGNLKKSVASKYNREKDAGPVSFFVRYRWPADTTESSFCTRKLNGNFIDFNERKACPLRFNSRVLEDWWNFKLQFKTYSRRLSQRLPCHIGDATLSLKSLLLQDRYASGEMFTLPLYASNTLFRDLNLNNEIIGNVHLSIKFESSATACGIALFESPMMNADNGTEQSSRRKYKNCEIVEDLQQQVLTPTGNSSQLRRSSDLRRDERRSVTISSTTRPIDWQEPIVITPIVLEMRINSIHQFWIKHRNLEGGESEGEVGVGKEMLVTSFLFLPGKQGVIHNRLMLSRLNKNYLILEVWRDGSRLGVSKIETDPIHAALNGGVTVQSGCLNIFNGQVDIVDIFSDKKVGELHVSLTILSETEQSDDAQNPEETDILGLEKKKQACEDDQTLGMSHASVQTSFLENQSSNSTLPSVPTAERNEEVLDRNDDVIDNSGKTNEQKKDFDEDRNKVELISNTLNTVANNSCQTDENENRVDGVLVEILIEEARNLPTVKSKGGGRVAPSCYVTLMDGANILSSQIQESNRPTWNFHVKTRIDVKYILDPRKYLILKVWHHRRTANSTARAISMNDLLQPQPNPETDQMLGFVAVDLTPLLIASFAAVSGWYNITDCIGKCRGQIKLTITPMESVVNTVERQYSRPMAEWWTTAAVIGVDETLIASEESSPAAPCSSFVTTGHYARFPSHLVNHSEQLIFCARDGALSSCSLVSEAASLSSNLGGLNTDHDSRQQKQIYQYWQPPTAINTGASSACNLSLMVRTLDQHLTDLTNLTDLLTSQSVSETKESVSSNAKTFTVKRNKTKENSNPQMAQQEGSGSKIVRKDAFTIVGEESSSSSSSSRTSLQTLSVDELPRDDLPNLTDLGLVLEDLGFHLADHQDTDRSTFDNGLQKQSFIPDI